MGNPVSHSRSPLLHNAGFQAAGHDAIYVPLLVDDLGSCMTHPMARDFAGLSVTIPHKVGRNFRFMPISKEPAALFDYLINHIVIAGVGILGRCRA